MRLEWKWGDAGETFWIFLDCFFFDGFRCSCLRKLKSDEDLFWLGEFEQKGGTVRTIQHPVTSLWEWRFSSESFHPRAAAARIPIQWVLLVPRRWVCFGFFHAQISAVGLGAQEKSIAGLRMCIFRFRAILKHSSCKIDKQRGAKPRNRASFCAITVWEEEECIKWYVGELLSGIDVVALIEFHFFWLAFSPSLIQVNLLYKGYFAILTMKIKKY